MSEMIPGTGAGPQSGGFFASDNERAAAYQRALRGDAVLEQMMHQSKQWERAERAARPMMGSTTAAQNQFLYNSAAGQVAQMGIGAVATRGLAGMGNPMEMAIGLQNFLGRSGGAYQDNTPVGRGAQRAVSGAGFMTEEVAKGMWKGVQESLYGKDGNQNRVSGLSMTQVGRMMSSMGPLDMQGMSQSTIRSASRDEILDRARETANNPLMKEKLSGITAKNFDAKLANAKKTGDTQLVGQLTTIGKSDTLVDVNQKYQKQLTDFTKASAAMVSTLGDVLASDDMVDMMNTAKVLSGKIIKNTKEARDVKTSIDRSISFAKTQGIDPKSYIADSVNAVHTASGFLEQQGIHSPALAAAIGRGSMEQSVMSGKTEGAAAGFSEGEARAMHMVGTAARIQESPDVAIALHQLQFKNLDPSARKEIAAKMEEFKTADTSESMAKVKLGLQSLTQKHFGISSYEYSQKQGGDAAISGNSNYADKLQEIMAANVQNSSVMAGTQAAFDTSSKATKTALGANGAETGGILISSLQESTRKRLIGMMASGDRSGVDALLTQNAGNLKDTKGNVISVANMTRRLEGPTGMQGSAAGLTDLMGSAMQIPTLRQSVSNEATAAKNAAIYEHQMAAGDAMQDKVRSSGKSITELIAEGFFTGPNGKMNPEAVHAIALHRGSSSGKAFAIGSKDGKMDISESAMAKILAKATPEEVAALTKGKSAKDFASMVQSDASGVTNAETMKLMNKYYTSAGIGKGQTAVVERDFAETVEDTASKTLSHKRLKELSGVSDLKYGNDSDMAKSIVDKMERHKYTESYDGMIGTEKKYESSDLDKALAGGDEGTKAMLKIQQMNKDTHGEFRNQLASRLDTAQREFVNSPANSNDSKNYKKDMDVYSGIMNKLDAGTTEGSDKVMHVGSIIVHGNFDHPGNKS